MQPRRNPYIGEHAGPLVDAGVIHRNAWIVHDVVANTERINLRRPAIGINRLRPFRIEVGLEDGDGFALGRRINQIVVLKAPPRGRVAAERFARKYRIGAGTRPNVDDLYFEHVTGLCAAYVDRPRANVHAKTFTGTAA